MVTRLELYQRMQTYWKSNKSQFWNRKFNDRFGVPPKEVENLLYILKIRVLAKDNRHRIDLQHGRRDHHPVVCRHAVEQAKVISLYREGIKIGNSQLRMSLRQPGKGWKTMLEEILAGMN